MKPHSLSKTGLSMSQAQSISNSCNQAAIEINRTLDSINNYSSQIDMNGKKYNLQDSFEIKSREKLFALIERKGKLHATQAFLMENIKAKETLLQEKKKEQADISSIEKPVKPVMIEVDVEPLVDEDWAWEQLTTAEYNDYLYVEALAAHIGQFIHKDGKLSRLRAELPTIKGVTFTEKHVPGGFQSFPIINIIHHTSEDLLETHNLFATKHREYEQKVNYYKAIVHNMITIENTDRNTRAAGIIDDVQTKNSMLQLQWQKDVQEYAAKVDKLKQEFEAKRNSELKEIAHLRISVPGKFKDIIDEFMPPSAD